jgi:hypothetical protein
LIDLVAFFRCLAAGHLRPVLIDDRVGVGVGLQLELYALTLGETFGEAVDVSESARLKVHVEICGSEVCPHGVEHEAEDDGVGGADDVELPSDQVVVRLTLFAGPDPVQCSHKEHGASDREGENEDVQRWTEHGVMFSGTISKLIEFLPEWFD